MQGLTTRNTRGPSAALLSTRIHLLDMALLKPTLPLGSRWGSEVIVSEARGPLHPITSLGLAPGPYHELALGQALLGDAAEYPGLMAALPGHLLALGRKLPALGGAQLSLNDLQGDGGREDPQRQGSEPGTPSPKRLGCTVPETSFTSELRHFPGE